MSSALKAAAVSRVSTAKPSSFYASQHPDDKNPVYQTFDDELQQFRLLIHKQLRQKSSLDCGSNHKFTTLFELWNKYEPLLPKQLFEEKMLEVGDFLASVEEYSLAMWQCYGRYLRSIAVVDVEEITQEEDFFKTFFPSGFDTGNAGLTFRALMGKAICTYRHLEHADPKLQNKDTLHRCRNLLNFLRLITQVVLKREKLCWLVYNGTINIYSVCRRLMAFGYPRMVLEYLIWACSCMEFCIPLLTVRYLPWRASLYTAVCQAFFDCNLSAEAESFSRRGLAKISELNELENMSKEKPSGVVEVAFREATIKMAIMIFKRTVFETRRRPKGILRPKNKINFKDALQAPWPRTQSERFLAEMCAGSAGQFLCILEAFSTPSRRLLQHGPPDPEQEVIDVYSELFLAAQEIVAGGGGNTGKNTRTSGSYLTHPLRGLVPGNGSLMEMAVKAYDGVTLNSVVRLVKWAFTYENWETFDILFSPINKLLKEHEDDEWAQVQLKTLLLLKRMKQFHITKKNRRVQLMSTKANPLVPPGQEGNGQATQSTTNLAGGQTASSTNLAGSKKKEKTSISDKEGTKGHPEGTKGHPEGTKGHQEGTKGHQDKDKTEDPDKRKIPEDVVAGAHLAKEGRKQSVSSSKSPRSKRDDLFNFTEALDDIVNSNIPPTSYDMDMLMDAVVFLWSKCKTVFQKFQTGSRDNTRVFNKMDDPNKWVFILEVIHRSLGWIGGATVDPAMSAEVAIRLAMVLECAANSGQDIKEATENNAEDAVSIPEARKILSKSPADQLAMSRDILEEGLINVSCGRSAVATTDGSSIADVIWAKELNVDLFAPVMPGEAEKEEEKNAEEKPSNVWTTVKDIQVELQLMYHRVTVKLDRIREIEQSKEPCDGSRLGAASRKTLPSTLPSAKSFKTKSEQDGTEKEKAGDSIPETFQELATRCNKNKVSKALLFMQRASLISSESTANAAEINKLVQEAEELLNNAMKEEKTTFVDNCLRSAKSVSTGRLPPAPLLLCRTDSTMTFKPAAWKPEGGEKVAWYRLYGRTFKGSNVKVRLNDYNIPGTSKEVPAFNCEMTAHSLDVGEKYLFAVAAFTADGKMIGGLVGDSTKPILASHPISVLAGWASLAETAYQTGCYDVAKRSCALLWSHFVATPPPAPTHIIETEAQNFAITYHKLNWKIVKLTSAVLLRQFVTSLFISVDIATIEKRLYCDSLCDYGPLLKGQTNRLVECEKLLVTIDLCGWLNDTSSALQAVIHAYGLLAPFIHFKMQTKPTVQILQRCMAVLIEIPISLRQKRGNHVTESLHHLAGCLTYYVTRTLRTWSEMKAAGHYTEAGRVLLTIQPDRDAGKGRGARNQEEVAIDNIGEIAESTNLEVFKKRNRVNLPGATTSTPKKSKGEPAVNEELRSLEAYLLTISKQIISPYMFDAKFWKQGQGTGDHELNGNEDPGILNAYIAFLPSRIAYKEVTKFSRRARYLEFLVQVMQRALSEGNVDNAIDWASEASDWLTKRNEAVMGGLLLRTEAGKNAVQNTAREAMDRLQADNGKHAAIVSQFGTASGEPASTKEPENSDMTAAPKKKRKKTKYKGAATMKFIDMDKLKALHLSPSMTEAQRQLREEAELMSLEVISLHLPGLLKLGAKRKRFRQIINEELPWRSQMNAVVGLSYFGRFIQKMELRNRLMNNGSLIYKSSFLDQEWFTLDESGTLIITPVSPGAPLRPASHVSRKSASKSVTHAPSAHTSPTRAGKKASVAPMMKRGSVSPRKSVVGPLADPSGLSTVMVQMKTAVESAALAVSGDLMDATDGAETPRTYRSDMMPSAPINKKAPPPEPGLESASPEVISSSLHNTFLYLKRSLVQAHRGHFWMQVQNIAKSVWNCAHTALLHLASDLHTLISMETLASYLWEVFYMTSDALLDMITELAQQKHKKKCTKSSEMDSGSPVRGSEDTEPQGSVFIGPEKESGGAGFKFDVGMDEAEAVDLRWCRKVVLRTLELLYHQNKMERLVHLAYRFNGVTSNRYATDTLPLVVQAQRKLMDRVESHSGSVEGPQPHLLVALDQLGCDRVTAANYAALQLKVTGSEMRQWQAQVRGRQATRASMMRSGHSSAAVEAAVKVDRLPDETMSLRLCCVPLDVESSLEELRVCLDLTPYTSQSLRHARRLLLLYLSGQQHKEPSEDMPSVQNAVSTSNMGTRGQTEIGFDATTGRPHAALVPERRKDEFHVDSDVKCVSLPKAQLPVVVAAYEKCIELLLSRNQKSLAAQAMRELGALHYHLKNRKAAYTQWCDCLDLILGTPDAVNTYRQVFLPSDNASKHALQGQLTQALLDKCGIWGCLLAGITAASIAQYIVTSDLGLKLKYSFLAGYLFKAVFRSTLPHPTLDRDYAMYDIGEGCEVTNLIPGINLLSDKFRCDVRALESSLRYVIEDLIRCGHNYFVLPLLSLYLYLVSQLCRDLGRTVEGRIMRLRVLTEVSLFKEGSETLIQLLWGARLPQPWDSQFRQCEGRIPTDVKFKPDRNMLHPENIKVMDCLLSKRLPTSLATLYGPHLTCRLSVAHANFLSTLADSIKAIPIYVDPSTYPSPAPVVNVLEDDSQSQTRSRKITKFTIEEEYKSVLTNLNTSLHHTGSGLKEEMVKGSLLKTATDMLQAMTDAIREADEEDLECERRSASELRLLIECLLGLARCGRLRHHARTGARCVQRAMRVMTNATILRKDKTNTKTDGRGMSGKRSRSISPSKYQRHLQSGGMGGEEKKVNYLEELENFKSRGQLDFRLWLTCRLEMARCLLCEVKGMGDVKGGIKTVRLDTPDTRATCLAGVSEADACGDVEMKVQFLVLLAQSAQSEGLPAQQIQAILKEVVETLNKISDLSFSTRFLKAETQIYLTDLELMTSSTPNDIINQLKSALNVYQDVHMDILKECESVGERVERQPPLPHLSSLSDPLENIYLPLLSTLVHIKLRIGHTKALLAAMSGQQKSPDMSMWLEALGILTTAATLSHAMVSRSADVEAELLLIIGKIHRQLMQLGHLDLLTVCSTLVEGIKVTCNNHGDLGLLRQFYLELASALVVSCGQASLQPDGSVVALPRQFSSLPTDSEPEIVEAASPTKSAKSGSRKPSPKKTVTPVQITKEEQRALEGSEEQRRRRAAWLALRCAAQVAECERSLITIQGESGQGSINEEIEIPEFIAYDLVSTYALGEKVQYFTNEIEAELSTMPESRLPKDSDFYEDQVDRVRGASQGLTWTNLIGYHSLLGRLCLNRGVQMGGVEGKETQESIPGFEFQLVLPDTERALGTRTVVRTPLWSSYLHQRVVGLHSFLHANMPTYQSQCVGVAVWEPALLLADHRGAHLEGAIMSALKSTGLADGPTAPHYFKTYRNNWDPLVCGSDSSEVLPPSVTSKLAQSIAQVSGLTTQDLGISTSQAVQPPNRIPGSCDPQTVLKLTQSTVSQSLLSTTEFDVCCQLYRPSFDPGVALSGSDKALLIYAATQKIDKKQSWTSAIDTGLLEVSASLSLSLFGRLRMLAQQAELLEETSTQSGQGDKSVSQGRSTAASKRTTKTKAKTPVPPAKLEKNMENLLRRSLDDLLVFLGRQDVGQFSSSAPDTASLLQIQFDVNRENLVQLKQLIDPEFGGLSRTGRVQAFLRYLLLDDVIEPPI